jgi:uncharacterized protein (TIGR03790 family)
MVLEDKRSKFRQMKNKLIRFAVLIFALAPMFVRADGGDEVLVVYNKNMPGSKAVADYYAKLRHVPVKQIYGFSLTTNETMSRANFRDDLQLPLARKLELDGLWKFGKTTIPATNGQPERVVRRVVASKIRYAVLCYGVPLRIANDPDLHEMIPTNVTGFFRNNGAAVDSELTLLPEVEMNLPLTALIPNPFYGTTNAAALNPTNGILLVTRLDGPSADIARGEVDKALEAERNGLWGRAYFDARGLPENSSYVRGDQIILGAAKIAKILGYETTIDDKPATFALDFPMSHIALYAGWYDENVSGPFTLPKVEFMPGAFAYHLHSFSAATIRSATNRWVGPLLAKGATCSMGTVDEPSLQFTPDIATFLARWSVGQMTFGEAAWMAQPALSWQTTVVGDPLYRPFGKLPEQLQTELTQRHSPLIEWSDLRIINASALRGATTVQLIEALENLPERTNSAVLTEKLADLCEADGKTLSAIDYYNQALQLNPSPEQRIRIRLTLADKYAAQSDKKKTYDDLWKIIDENPDYPAKFDIMKRLLDLAIAIGDKNEITRCVQGMQKYAPGQ